MARTLSGYTSALSGVVNFTDPNHPGFGLPYLILNGPDNGGFAWSDAQTGSQHTVIFCIPWENILSFRQYVLMGVVSTVLSGGGTSLSRQLPMVSPFASIFPFTYAIGMDGKGSGLDANVTDSRLFADCIVEVAFSTLTWQTEGSQPFIEISGAGSADYITVPDAKLVFAGNSEAIEHDAGVLVGQLALQAKVFLIPNFPSWLASVLPLKGYVNSTTVTLFGYNFDPGVLLFPTFDYTWSTDAFGNINATATVQLIQRDLPWNQGIRSDGNVDTIIISGTSKSPYELADLNGIFSAT